MNFNTMNTKKIIIATAILTLLYLPFIALAQVPNQQSIINNLCKKWMVDSIEVNDMNKKFPAPKNIKNNYTDFRKDGTFQGQEGAVVIKGKWKFDFEKMQIINYDIDNPEVKGEIVFTIIEINEKHLAIRSKPMSGNQITMHYKPEKN
jgi:hypothetical protein